MYFITVTMVWQVFQKAHLISPTHAHIHTYTQDTPTPPPPHTHTNTHTQTQQTHTNTHNRYTCMQMVYVIQYLYQLIHCDVSIPASAHILSIHASVHIMSIPASAHILSIPVLVHIVWMSRQILKWRLSEQNTNSNIFILRYERETVHLCVCVCV